MSAKKNISIVDDDESVRNALSGLFRSVGLSTSQFASAEDFFKSDALHTSDCILTDVHMPRVCGRQFQKALIERNCKAPLIVVTAFPDMSLRDRVMAAGAFCVLIKPFDAQELLQTVEHALQIDLG